MTLSTDRSTPNPTEAAAAPVRPHGFATVEHVAFGRTRDRVLMGTMAAYAIAATAWLASGHIDSWLQLAPLFLNLPLAVIAAVLAWRASREMGLDQGTRRFWRARTCSC